MSDQSPIYLDHHATTPVDPRVLESMLPAFGESFGNPASRSHRFGWDAEKALKQARAEVASLINARPREIVFTSGATESNNIALIGAAETLQQNGRHIISTNAEHKSVLEPLKHLEQRGFEVTRLPVDPHGQIAAEQVAAAIRPETILISVIWANNEVGTINPIAEIGQLATDKGIWFHVDAAQALGKLPIDVQRDGVHLLSASAHKLYGPKGVGMLYVRRSKPRVRLAPLMFGGGQELGLRPGTSNVPGIVGFGAACRIAGEELTDEIPRLLRLRERLYQGICAGLETVHLNGHPTERLAGNLNLSIAYVEGEALMMGIPEIAVSSGSACISSQLEPSYVLRAMGVSDSLIHTSIRFGLGRFTTVEQVDLAVRRVIGEATRLRQLSPLYEMAREGIDLARVEWKTI